MNSKERVKKAINHKDTDRVPFDIFGTSPDNKSNIQKYCNAGSFEEMYRILGIDLWEINPMPYIGPQRFYKGEAADFWGITSKAYSDGDSSNSCPLREVSSVDEVEEYCWPDISSFSDEMIERDIEKHNEFSIIGGVWAPIFHNVTWLCGFENTLVNFSLQSEVSHAIIRNVTDFWISYTKKVLEAGRGKIDIIENCNDFGTQNSLILSPDMFRTFLKPALKRLYDTIRSYDVKVMQHCCGSVKELIGDFIEIGADIINPVQVSAKDMDIVDLKTLYGEKITFHGGIDTQYLLPNGSVEEVRKEVRKVLNIFKNSGGYILSGSQGFESDIPMENIIAMFEEGRLTK